MKIKVKVIAPYEGLRDLVLDLAKEHEDLVVNAEVGDLRKGLEIAKRAEREGYDLLISRGGTATLIRANVMIPMVEIPVSGYDILRSFTLIKDYKGKVGIIGFSNTTEGAASISTLLDFDISRFTVYHESEVEGAIRQAIDNGIEIVLGDVITVHVASKMGLQGILITSGQESVREALENVHKVYEIVKRKEVERKQLEYLIEHDDRGILLTDDEYNIIYMNQIAKSLFNTLEIGNKLTFPDSKFEFDQNKDLFLIKIGENLTKIVVNKKKIMIEGKTKFVYYFINYPRLEHIWIELNKHKVKKMIKKDGLANFGQFIKSSQSMNDLVEQAKYYASKKEPVWITGEKGTGKDMLAESIHQASSFFKGIFLSYSFYDNESDKFEEYLSNAGHSSNLFELVQGGTLYLEGVEVIPEKIYHLIIKGYQKWPNLKVILSSQITIQEFIKKSDEAERFCHFFSPFVLSIPPLRERINDIPDLVRLFLAKYNTKYGKQVVGIKSDALEILKEYPWPHNVQELDKIIEEVIFRVKGYYIEEKDLLFLKQRYKDSVVQKSDKENIYLPPNMTLEEMEFNIIMQVLKEEDMNQSKAAKRLGINRTTLWRKIKSKMSDNI
ncbi:PrpR N-terminal domain-containing protein [Tepidibacillus infernus]|uniref:sigma-54-dependent Fis family transcriptional regulator n=1 Tax=Tepidibacillus infernus TaxID=1806172 RepID=UPI003B6D0D12